MIYTAPWQAPSPSAGKKPKPLCWGCNLNHSQVHSVATSHQGGGSVPSAPGPCLPHSSRAGKDNPGPSGLRKKQQGKKKKEKKIISSTQRSLASMGNVYPSPSPHELFSALSRLSARMPWPISAPMLCAAGPCAPCLGQQPLGWTPLVLLQRSAPYICPSRHPRIKHSTPGCLWLYLNPGSLRWRADSARMEFLCSYSSDRPKKWAPIKKI